jgi:hypothetical protein
VAPHAKPWPETAGLGLSAPEGSRHSVAGMAEAPRAEA